MQKVVHELETAHSARDRPAVKGSTLQHVRQELPQSRVGLLPKISICCPNAHVTQFSVVWFHPSRYVNSLTRFTHARAAATPHVIHAESTERGGCGVLCHVHAQLDPVAANTDAYLEIFQQQSVNQMNGSELPCVTQN
jgi:hypothetical protein